MVGELAGFGGASFGSGWLGNGTIEDYSDAPLEQEWHVNVMRRSQRRQK